MEIMIKLLLLIILTCSSLRTMAISANNTSDIVPPFECVYTDEGNIPDSRPQLAQRIDGTKEIIIVSPSNNSILDNIVCTSLYDYFSELGITVYYHYAIFDSKDTYGNVTLVQRYCTLSELDFLNDVNTLVMIPNYNWAYSDYSNRLDIHLDILDLVGVFQWEIILDNLSVDVNKQRLSKNLIKKLQKQVTSSYVYNPEFSIKPSRDKFNWKEIDFKNYAEQNPNNTIDGIYDFENVKIGIYADETGNCFFLYLSGGNPEIWEEGDLKGIFESTSTPNMYKGMYIDQYYVRRQASLILENNFLSLKIGNEEVKPLKKIYPKAGTTTYNEIKQWSGSGFALLDGYIVTNNHVADEAVNIEVFGINGDFTKGHKASIVGKDKVSDLALLKLDEECNNSYWKSVPYSIKKGMSEVGESIYALGYPLIGTMGEEVKLTTGVISARSGFGGDVTNYQISAPIQPGSSGGPMFDEKGNLVGIVCAKHQGAENVGYAIKPSYLYNLIESIVNLNIIPKSTELKGLSLKNQVKSIRNYTYLIKCSK